MAGQPKLVVCTGGEPLLRDDLEPLIGTARELGLYTNLITSAVSLTRPRLESLRAVGLDAIQISVQGTSESDAQLIAGRACLAEKLGALFVCTQVVVEPSSR